MSYKSKLDQYEIVARYIPAIISVIPVSHFFLTVFTSDFIKSLTNGVSWMLVADLSIPIVFGIAIVQLQTWFSKTFVEEKVFGPGGKNFPTTNILLYSERLYSKAKKDELRTLIKCKYGIELPTEAYEMNNLEEVRLQCREVVSQIRRTVANGGMVRSYNIRYGFLRNLIGGIIWLFGAIGNSIYYGINNEYKTAIFFGIWAFVVILLYILKRSILEKAAFTYADALFTEFLSDNKE